MDKTGELKANQSVCDLCSSPAITVVGGNARCRKHASEKQAQWGKPLRACFEEISDAFKSIDSKE